MTAVDPAEKIINDENHTPAKEHPIIKHGESPEDAGHKRKMSVNIENEAGDAKKKKTEDIETPAAPEKDAAVEDAAVAEQAEEAKPEKASEDLIETEDELLQGNASETEVSTATTDGTDEEDKKEVDEGDKKETDTVVAPVVN